MRETADCRCVSATGNYRHKPDQLAGDQFEVVERLSMDDKFNFKNKSVRIGLLLFLSLTLLISYV
ncbi:hypothetical protein AAKU67_002979 [Oxalobacteraceae bacterium GrIS 2.11]